jgi:brefeldin A-inhibited guanine nucleotide-exchange protein
VDADYSSVENDTLARIGTSCLQQLLESNVKKLSVARWERVATTFVKLFRTTTPHQLFDENLRVEIDSGTPEPQETYGRVFTIRIVVHFPYAATDGDGQAIIPAPLSPTQHDSQKVTSPKTTLNDRRRIFKQIIVKCVLQLLLIETTNDLLRNDEVYRTIPPEHLLRLMGVLDHSYQFARMFNEDKELRTGLWKVGEFAQSSRGKARARLMGLPIRIHEAPPELAKAGIEQCCDSGTHPLANVL